MTQKISVKIEDVEYIGAMSVERKKKSYYLTVHYKDFSKSDGIPYPSEDSPQILFIARLLLIDLIKDDPEICAN